MINETDSKIIEVLKQNSDMSIRAIARLLKMPSTTVYDRVKGLKKKGIIKRYTIELDNEKIGKPIRAYILISVDPAVIKAKKITQHIISDKLSEYPFIEEACTVTGRTDIIIKVNVSDIKELDHITINQLRPMEGVLNTETLVVLYKGKKIDRG